MKSEKSIDALKSAKQLRAQLKAWLEEVAQLTDEEWENDPAAEFGGTKTFCSDVEDGAAEHDHYIYGSRKRTARKLEGNKWKDSPAPPQAISQ